MPPIDVGARQLPVHVARRSFVPEPVAPPRTNPLDAAVNRRQEHYVREVIQARGVQKRLKEPRPDHPVVDGRESSRRVATAAAAAACVTTSFCSFASGSQGVIAPRAMKPKKASPSTSTLGSNRRARTRATLDFPAPGGPVTIKS